MPGDEHAPVREGVEQGHVAGAEVGVAAFGPVVGGADADEDAAGALVSEVELHLLEGAFDEERRVRVGHGAQAREGEAPGGAHEELLADADVEDAAGVLRGGLGEGVVGDVGEDEREERVHVEQRARVLGPGLAHGLGFGGHGGAPGGSGVVGVVVLAATVTRGPPGWGSVSDA
nr:hypothetical protein GCM10025732_34010 [Glycomyces mayteni]